MRVMDPPESLRGGNTHPVGRHGSVHVDSFNCVKVRDTDRSDF